MTYEDIITGSPVVLVEFYATWCGHCARMQPVIEEIRDMLSGSVPVYQLDIDQNKETADNEELEGTPTFIIYKDGKEVWRWSGEIDGNTLLAKIQSYEV